MRQLVWAAEARRDAAAIFNFIAEHNAPAADRMKTLIAEKTQQLIDLPFIHRAGRMPGTREAVIHPNYIIIYRVYDNRVRILSIIHARQLYP